MAAAAAPPFVLSWEHCVPDGEVRGLRFQCGAVRVYLEPKALRTPRFRLAAMRALTDPNGAWDLTTGLEGTTAQLGLYHDVAADTVYVRAVQADSRWFMEAALPHSEDGSAALLRELVKLAS
jgi:hypothetical protein